MENDIKNDKELYSYFVQRNATLCNENFSYLIDHKETRLLLNDYLSSLLLHKPDDVFKYTKDYFQFLCEKPNMDRLLFIVGPTCSGRTVMINKLVAEFPEVFECPISYTTSRDEKLDDEKQTRIDKKTYLNLLKSNEVIEFSNSNEDLRGFSIKDANRIASEGKIAIIEIDILTAKKIYKSGFGAHYVAVFPSTVDLLRDRLKIAMKTSTEHINQILENANKEIKEIEKASYFSYRIINDDIDSGFEELRNAVFSIYPFLNSNFDEILKHNKISVNQIAES